MKKFKLLILLCVVVGSTSCLRTTYYVGSARPSDPKPVKVGAEQFHHHYLAGLISGGNATVDSKEYTNSSDNFSVRTSLSFVDLLIGNVTMNIYTPTRTTWFMSVDEIKRQSNANKSAQ